MTNTTSNSMNVLVQRTETAISVKVANSFKKETKRLAKNLGLDLSKYVKLAIDEKNARVKQESE